MKQMSPVYTKRYTRQNTETNITYCCSVLLSQPQKNKNGDTFPAPRWQAWCFPGGSQSKNTKKKKTYKKYQGDIMWKYSELQMCMLYSMLCICTACVHALMINSAQGHLGDNYHLWWNKTLWSQTESILWIIYITCW